MNRRRRNSKLQAPSSREAPNSKPRNQAALDLAGAVLPRAAQSPRSGSPNVKLEVSLELGAWCLEIYSSKPHFFPSTTARCPAHCVLCFVAFCFLTSPAFTQEKISYQDHILPLVEANCSKCHNADKKKADLELTSYQGHSKAAVRAPSWFRATRRPASCGKP